MQAGPICIRPLLLTDSTPHSLQMIDLHQPIDTQSLVLLIHMASIQRSLAVEALSHPEATDIGLSHSTNEGSEIIPPALFMLHRLSLPREDVRLEESTLS